MRDLALRLFHRSGLAELSRRILARSGRFVIELHGVPGSRPEGLPEPLRPCLVRDDLRAILDWLDRRFAFLGAEEFLAAETQGVLLTFDDGFAHQAEAVPLLEEYGAPAVFFVTTRHVENSTDWLPFVRRQIAEHGTGTASEEDLHALFDGMSRDQLAACAGSPRVTIGSHTVSHPFLTRCDDDELRRELVASRRCLEELTGETVDLLAYPGGDYDARVAEAAREAGYRAAFVEDSRGLGLGRFEIPRIGLYRAEAPYLAAKLSGLHRRPLPVRGSGSS